MKRSLTLALIAVGLAYALAFQFLRYQRHVAQESEAVLPLPRPSLAPPEPRPRTPPPERRLEFGGYPCQGDCAEHRAGYRWAEQNGLADPDDCTGNTGPFIEGCRVYARQQMARRAPS